MVLRGSYVTVTQNALDHRIIHANAVQIRRQASAEAMPAVPGDAGTLQHVLHFPLIASVQVKRMPNRISENWARHRITTSLAMYFEPLSKLWNDWNGGLGFRRFRITHCVTPHGSSDVQPAE